MGLIEDLNTLFELARNIAFLAGLWGCVPSADRQSALVIYVVVSVSIAFTTNIAAPPPSPPLPPSRGKGD